jgi:WD40 repeat protein
MAALFYRYGHAYEIFALAANQDGQSIFASCKSSSSEYAVIREWRQCKASPEKGMSSRTWTLPRSLMPCPHTLTVTKLVLSPADPETGAQLLLSVSRDRSWAVYAPGVGKCEDPALSPFRLIAHKPRAHDRIIWAADWAPRGSDGGRCFGTASRDKTVRIWLQGSDVNAWEEAARWTASAGLTALSSLDIERNGVLLWIAGDETGRVYILAFDPALSVLSCLAEFPDRFCHGAAVVDVKTTKLADGCLLIATGGEDNSLRVYSLAPSSIENASITFHCS